ncbi:MAG: hypothetical protein ACU0A6_16690 [Shimia sp.]|uniref:hypothetical protein n=1 Tax=Shimia sp. TaxID=1954381 RepID=UPI004059F69B
MRFFCFAALLSLLAAACAKPVKDTDYRTLTRDDVQCGFLFQLSGANRETPYIRDEAKEGPNANCSFQQHELPVSRNAGEDSLWEAEAKSGLLPQSPTDGTDVPVELTDIHLPTDTNRYTLAFVEMNDAGALHNDRQMTQLVEHLRAQQAAGRQNYVLSYVHGWRHDAKPKDNDVRKFRVILGYARAALNSRCIAEGRYCDAVVTGVYVGWRGRAHDEDSSDDSSDASIGDTLGAVATLDGRKKTSDALGDPSTPNSGLAMILEKLDAVLAPNPQSASADRFLIFGQSLGGNMLATLMRGKVRDALYVHKVRSGKVMKPPLGDLVVLINPAAESVKWIDNQKRMRRRHQIKDSENFITTKGARRWDRERLESLYDYFPQRQRPVYVSLTATSDWARNETNGRIVRFDAATKDLFPFTGVSNGNLSEYNTTAIGHLSPSYRAQDRDRLVGGTDAVGASHEFAVVRGVGARTSYGNATNPARSWCAPATGWLYQYRALAAAHTPGNAGWDYGMVERVRDNKLVGGHNVGFEHNEAAIQWRQSLYLKGQKNRMSVEPGNSPFWNVRAFDTALQGHGGWVNYATWCGLHQLVLDDVGAPGQPAPMVQEMLANTPKRGDGG